MRALYGFLTLLLAACTLIIASCFTSDNGTTLTFDAGALRDVTIHVHADGGKLVLYSVGGTVDGLVGSGLVLEGDGIVDIAVQPAKGSPVGFVFPAQVPSGTPFSVAVKTQPTNPPQTCSVVGGTGVVGTGNVGTIVVNCSTNTYVVGGTVTGVQDPGLVLHDNGGDPIAVSSDGTFAFPNALVSGSPYAVTVGSSPSYPKETCTVSQGSGTVTNANITSVQVSCTVNTYRVGGTVVGLVGTGLVLQDNHSDDVVVNASGGFTFPTRVASGGPFSVTIKTPPSSPMQVCSVSGAAGTVGTGDVTSIVVNCSPNTFTVGGTVTGLTGQGLILQNAGSALPISANGGFAFPGPLPTGAPYNVTIGTQPGNPTQMCTITSAGGSILNADVTSVEVQCSTVGYTIGGQVSGLAPTAVVALRNGQDTVQVSANGSFTFPSSLPSGAGYGVTIQTQPTSPVQNCTVSSGSGVVTNASVTTVVVQCATLSFTVGGQVSGLSPSRSPLVLQNGPDTLPINLDGPFTFATPVLGGAGYAVTIQSQPSGLQQCAISGGTGSGVVGNGNVTSVVVTCTPFYTIGGQVSGLSVARTPLVLQNGADTVQMNSDGGFTFATAVPTGTGYDVTIQAQPFGGTPQLCTVSPGTGMGMVNGANVTTVLVTCAPEYTISVSADPASLGGDTPTISDGTQTLSITGTGPFTFAPLLAGTYSVSVSIAPTDSCPTLSCTLSDPATQNPPSNPLSVVLPESVDGGSPNASLVLNCVVPCGCNPTCTP